MALSSGVNTGLFAERYVDAGATSLYVGYMTVIIIKSPEQFQFSNIFYTRYILMADSTLSS